MRRVMTLLAVALLGYALLPTAAQAQVIYVQPGRAYAAPIIVPQAVVPSYYYAPPSISTYSSGASYSYYPAPTMVHSYSAYPSVMTHSAPTPVFVQPSGVYSTRTYYGYGVLRPRGYYNETYYTPLR